MKLLKDKKGFSYIITCVIILAVALIIFSVMQYAFIYHVVNEQKGYVQLQLDSYVTKQAIGYYDALKQGNAYSGYIDNVGLVSGAYSLLGFPQIITLEYRETLNERTVFTMSRPEIYALTGGSIGLYVKYTLTVPFEMFGRKLADIKIPVETVSRFTQK